MTENSASELSQGEELTLESSSDQSQVSFCPRLYSVVVSEVKFWFFLFVSCFFWVTKQSVSICFCLVILNWKMITLKGLFSKDDFFWFFVAEIWFPWLPLVKTTLSYRLICRNYIAFLFLAYRTSVSRQFRCGLII